MYRVVIADDEPKVSQLIKALIDWEALNLELVAIAGDGIEAFEKIKLLHPDIVITDIRMPGYDGIELIKAVNQVERAVDFIIVSGYQHFDYAHSAIKYGVKDYLLKPLNKAEINETLAKIIKRYEERDAESSQKSREIKSRRQLELASKILNRDVEAVQRTMKNLDSQFQMQFDGEIFQVFIIKPDFDYDGSNEELLQILMSKVLAICNQYLKSVFQTYLTLDLKDRIVVVGNYQSLEKKSIRKAFHRIIDECHSLRDLFNSLVVTVAIGQTVDGLARLYEAYESADFTIYQRLDAGCGGIVDWKDHDIERNREWLPIEIRRKLINAVESLDEKALSESLVEGFKAFEKLSGRQIMEGCLEMIEVVSYALKHHADFHEEFPEASLKKLEMQTSRRALYSLIEKALCLQLSEALKHRINEANKPVRDAQKFIQAHYASNINLDEISGMVGFSPSYFSTLFKRETGYNFLEYVTMIRIKQAKQILSESHKSILEIAYEVGYQDLKHFTKQFKKITGLNPSQYRKLYY